MKKFYKLIAAATLSLMTVGVFAQTLNQTGNTPLKHTHFKGTTKKALSKFNPKTLGTNTSIALNYDSADATVWQSLSTTYYHNQGELMNYYYTYPADTVGSNYDVIQTVGVAFDSLVDAYNPPNTPYSYSTVSGLNLDYLVIPIVHVNNSGKSDTLDVQVFACNAHGYPTNKLITDYKVTGTQISDTNNDGIIGNTIVPINLAIPAPYKFYVQLNYRAPKVDSCWFIYGFGGFSGACDGGTYTLADSTNFSIIKFTTKKGASQFTANSFESWAEYGMVPDSTGGSIFYPCGANDSTFVAGDGDNYIENVNIYAQVTINPTGINEVNSNGLTIGQNFPNPFNQTTQINYSVTKSSDVTFSVYDMEGRKLMVNNYNDVTPGQHVITLSANQFAAGVYFYTFNVNGNTVTKKMVITE